MILPAPAQGKKQKERGGYYVTGRPYYVTNTLLCSDGIGTKSITMRLCGDLRHIYYSYYAIFSKLFI